MDLTNLTLQQLRDLQGAIALEIKTREAQTVQDARAKILEIANSVGIPVKELLGKLPKKSGPAPIKFRHPENAEQQWSGRGRIPKWVKEWESSGKSVDALRVS